MGRSSQDFINQNRKPRVHIEYKVDIGNAEKVINLPFVMGVMADLSGKPAEALPDVAGREFKEIDIDNFDKRLKAMEPRVAFQVPNVLSSDGGNLSVDITFEKMEDFSPAKVAEKVDALKKLLDTRTELSNLITFMDGKGAAEKKIVELLKDRTMLESLATKLKTQSEVTESTNSESEDTNAEEK